MNIELNIEKLVLHGLSIGDHYRIGTAVERELTRLFAEQGMPPSLITNNEVARIDGGAFDMARDFKAATIGARVAERVYGSLRR